MALFTSDISGVHESWVIDVSWVKDELTGLHQDEAIDFEVWDQQEAIGGIRAVRIAGEGSFVNRLNWGVREEYTTCNDSIRAMRSSRRNVRSSGVRRRCRWTSAPLSLTSASSTAGDRSGGRAIAVPLSTGAGFGGRQQVSSSPSGARFSARRMDNSTGPKEAVKTWGMIGLGKKAADVLGDLGSQAIDTAGGGQ